MYPLSNQTRHLFQKCGYRQKELYFLLPKLISGCLSYDKYPRFCIYDNDLTDTYTNSQILYTNFCTMHLVTQTYKYCISETIFFGLCTFSIFCRREFLSTRAYVFYPTISSNGENFCYLHLRISIYLNSCIVIWFCSFHKYLLFIHLL